MHNLAWSRGCGARRNEQAHVVSSAHRREDAWSGLGRLGVELDQHWLVVCVDDAVLEPGGNAEAKQGEWPVASSGLSNDAEKKAMREISSY